MNQPEQEAVTTLLEAARAGGETAFRALSADILVLDDAAREGRALELLGELLDTRTAAVRAAREDR